MKCDICNRTIYEGEGLCSKCTDTYVYDNRIDGYRLKKNALLHEHIRESRLRKILNRIFGRSNVLEECSFDWCRNPETGVMLRFDFAIVNAKSFFLVEFNGEQHYKYVRFFHKSKMDFKKQRQRDKYKVIMTKKYNIPLVVIPYNVAITEDNIWKRIRRTLKRSKYEI